uniref:Uncharacterized protein n=1 Tax=Arundo donax TaxID=35708 RepID=A0A0A9ANN4_ARUDO
MFGFPPYFATPNLRLATKSKAAVWLVKVVFGLGVGQG